MITMTAFTLGVDAATSFRTHCLEALSKAVKIDLPERIDKNIDNDSTWSFAGKQLRVRTNAYGDVSHIGYKLFDSHWIKDYEALPLLDFIERYALEQDVHIENVDKTEEASRKNVTFIEGNASMLRLRTPDIPFTINEKERREYSVKWGKGGNKVCMIIPADYQLITGTNAIELENIFERDVRRLSSVLIADTLPNGWNDSEISRSDSLVIASNGYYLSQMIRSDLYMYEVSGKSHISLDTSKPLQSVNNILLTGCCNKEIPVELTIDKYGYIKTDIEISWQQFMLYCQQENCKFYLGIKSFTEETITATLFAVNYKMAYNHMISLKFPLSILYKGEGKMKGTLYAYTPLHNISEQFFFNNLNQDDSEH
ncbi:hypothetical protein H8784_13310 [Parabacteroides acidifaciens]|uniref:Uncharacterized protein n=2 Tax=Parabacteroides acidifaciens TaxID=2290935 RepID=A0A3D8HCY2_9BACT|nr:hypothetical protein [Parabacteroides acidifaciens]RDU48610.1 hypothetical protein DWU89_13670 [Parabacteroides acidifaciens]